MRSIRSAVAWTNSSKLSVGTRALLGVVVAVAGTAGWVVTPF